jgi:hypothetical protein
MFLQQWSFFARQANESCKKIATCDPLDCHHVCPDRTHGDEQPHDHHRHLCQEAQGMTMTLTMPGYSQS